MCSVSPQESSGNEGASDRPLPVEEWLALYSDANTRRRSARLAAEQAIAQYQALARDSEQARNSFIHLVVSRGFFDCRKKPVTPSELK
jgi:hypothetical protein